jgi:hypothetical protein
MGESAKPGAGSKRAGAQTLLVSHHAFACTSASFPVINLLLTICEFFINKFRYTEFIRGTKVVVLYE